MTSDNANPLDLLPEADLLTLYQERFPGWAVPPIISPSSEVRPSPLRTRLVRALAWGQPVVEWEQMYGNPPPGLEF